MPLTRQALDLAFTAPSAYYLGCANAGGDLRTEQVRDQVPS